VVCVVCVVCVADVVVRPLNFTVRGHMSRVLSPW
jgi:hypothetical protein